MGLVKSYVNGCGELGFAVHMEILAVKLNIWQKFGHLVCFIDLNMQGIFIVCVKITREKDVEIQSCPF